MGARCERPKNLDFLRLTGPSLRLLPPERRSQCGTRLGRRVASLGRSALPLRSASLNGIQLSALEGAF